MKMKNAVPELIQNNNAIIASFGNARLMKLPSGHCELVGGSIEDRALAGEWISLFMHELVACTRNETVSKRMTFSEGTAKPHDGRDDFHVVPL